MPRVTVQPSEFAMVEFDAPTIEALVETLAEAVDSPALAEIRVEIDETVPLGSHRVASLDPVVLTIEGGALENSRAPRKFDPGSATDVVGRLLFEAADRGDDTFAAPDPNSLSLPQRAAWDAYNAGRVDRLRALGQRQRWLYAFRTRHGFTDAGDQAFDALWTGQALTWAQIESLSEQACLAAAA